VRIHQAHGNYRQSARNLLHYLAFRRRDLRPLQGRLAALGLSSLGRAESHVLGTVDAVLGVLRHLAQDPLPKVLATPDEMDLATGPRLLREHTNALLGCAPPGRDVRIMVTMPSEAGENYLIVHDLLQQGMDCMRINCAHDEAACWLRMIQYLRQAEQSLGRSCRVVMDLAGPKLRTGPIKAGPPVVKVRPVRDALGRVTAPARVWLTTQEVPQPPPSPASAQLEVPARWLALMTEGETITFTDARGAHRALTLVDCTGFGCWAEATRTAYFVPGTRLKHPPGTCPKGRRKGRVGSLPAREATLVLKQGDPLLLTRDQVPGRKATFDQAGKLLTPAMIGCTMPEAFATVRAGEAIWFDDGRIGGVIEKVEEDRVHVRITQAHLKPLKLGADKGINLPDSDLRLGAMTAKDLEDLAFVATHADVVELSFVNRDEDVAALQQHLEAMGGTHVAMVLKIETRRGFENLPDLLLTAMRWPCCGVMIARGDLAVECGFERLAEVQEEILWICEAAQVPVIWATQVLETLAKDGMPSRAEITDAAMGRRAECIMLNKGPYVVSAVRVLEDILRRMRDHQTKKGSMLRKLRLAHLPGAGLADALEAVPALKPPGPEAPAPSPPILHEQEPNMSI
jgi:pyruvate kinase